MKTRQKWMVPLAFVALAAAIGAGTPANAAPGAAAGTSEVYSVIKNADGTVTESVYTPAPGVSATALASRLTARGVPGLAVRSATAEVSAQVASCSNGTARTWASAETCFVRWSYNGAVRPIINFVDSSAAQWPVGRAVTRWNNVSGIDSIYRPASSGCDGAPVHCVKVSSYSAADGAAAVTNRTLNAAQTYYSSASVKLNNYYAGDETDRWTSACHELGHVLGLDHNTSRTSCLYASQGAGVSKYPNGDDEVLLERYY